MYRAAMLIAMVRWVVLFTASTYECICDTTSAYRRIIDARSITDGQNDKRGGSQAAELLKIRSLVNAI